MPIDVAIPFVATKVDFSHIQSEAQRAKIFIECIQQIWQHVHAILDRASAKYKQHHDNIECQTTSWWATKFRYIGRRSILLNPRGSCKINTIINGPPIFNSSILALIIRRAAPIMLLISSTDHRSWPWSLCLNRMGMRHRGGRIFTRATHNSKS